MTSRLERYEAKYRSLTAELSELGYVVPGSLVARQTSCGKPGCRCMANPPQRHGPYFQWSRTVDAKTVSRRLDTDEAKLYREWIANWHQLKSIIDQMVEVSEAAGEILLRRTSEGASRS